MARDDAMPMNRLVRRALAVSPRRARTAMLGVGTSTALILLLGATYRTVSSGIVDYAGQAEVDLWVAPRGTDNLVRSSAVLPHQLARDIDQMEGVAATAPLIRSFVTAQTDQARITLLAVGYPGPDGLGGPRSLQDGQPPSRPGQLTLDRASAFRLGVQTRDSVEVNGQPFRVVGITRRTNLMATQFAFMDASQAEHASGFKDRVSFVAVKLAPATDATATAAAIRERYDVDVFDRDTWVANNLAEVSAGFRPMLAIVSSAGIIAAIVLVVLLVQSVVDDRRAEIAVLLAMGTPHRSISRAIVTYVAGLVAVGSFFGGLFGYALAVNFDRWLPTVEMEPALADILGGVALLTLVGVLAAIVPTLRLREIDPVEAFRP